MPARLCDLCAKRQTAVNTITGRCSACNSNLSRWRHKRPAERLVRRENLTIYTKRIEFVIEAGTTVKARKR